MTKIISVPDLRRLTLAHNDPKFVAAVAIAKDAKQEAAIRRAAIAARITRMALPAAAYLTFDFSDRYHYGVEILTIRDKDRQLLLTTDDDLLPDGMDGAELTQLHEDTADEIALLLSVADSHDSQYFGTVDSDAPEDDVHETDVYELDIDAVLAELAELDHKHSAAGFLAQVAEMVKDGEMQVPGEAYLWENDEAHVALMGLISQARMLLGLPADYEHHVNDNDKV